MGDLTISITLDSTIPAYRQVMDQVRVHLASGELAAGDALPSVRVLAGHLGVHFNTVADAYRELAAEGWIDLAHGKRAVVLPRSQAASLSKNEAEPLRQRLRALVAEMRLKGIAAKLVRDDVDEILANESVRKGLL